MNVTPCIGKKRDCWNKRGSDMIQLSFDDNKSINIQ
jgi:hypothetical protein